MAHSGATARRDGDDDEALLARFAGGDQSAARELAARHTPRLMALGVRMLRDQAEAEDVAQETMLRAWKTAAKWKPGDAKFSTWLHRVALNLCYDRLRKKPMADLESAPEPEDEALQVADAMEADARAQRVRAAIDDLPDRQKAALTMRHFEGYGNPETAEVLGLSVEAVESLLSRARRALRQSLAGEFELLMED